MLNPMFDAILQNATAAPIKRSNVDHTTNLQILFLFSMLVSLGLFTSIGNVIWTSKSNFRAFSAASCRLYCSLTHNAMGVAFI